jgi:hypothetical protein
MTGAAFDPVAVTANDDFVILTRASAPFSARAVANPAIATARVQTVARITL